MLENNECYETNKMLNWVRGNREFWGERVGEQGPALKWLTEEGILEQSCERDGRSTSGYLGEEHQSQENTR